MNRTLLKRSITKVAAWAGLTLLCVATAVAQDASQGQGQSQNQGQRTDGQIEMDVVHALDGSAALKNDLITAATIQGQVTLSGTVSSDASKHLAEQITSHVDGVAKVNNNLKVGNPTQDAQYAPPPDAGAQEMPDGQQAQAPPTPGLPPPGPAPDQAQGQDQGQNQGPGPGQGQPYPQQPAPSLQQSYPQQDGGYPQGRPQYQGQQNQAPQNQGPQSSPYPPQYAQGQPQYSNQPNSPYPPQYQQPQYAAPRGPVTIPQGTLLYLRTNETVDSKRAKDGEPVQLTVIQDVVSGGVLAIPRGATVHGVITEDKHAGALAGNAVVALQLTSLDLGGRSYQLSSDSFRVKGPNKAGETVGNAVGAGIIGTIIGCAVGRGAGCAVGAGVGVAAGTAGTAASGGPRAWIPAEALVSFHLANPVTVDPVAPQEAARLAEGLYPGGPSLYRRGPYGPRYYAGYPYPPVYYRPYYMTGGYYYWR